VLSRALVDLGALVVRKIVQPALNFFTIQNRDGERTDAATVAAFVTRKGTKQRRVNSAKPLSSLKKYR
jgi:hypothetical protein